MLGHATIEEKYKENMKNTLFILSKCNENLAFKNQLLFSGPDGAKKFQDPLNLDLDDLKKKKGQGALPHMLPRGNRLEATPARGLVFLQGSGAHKPDPHVLGRGSETSGISPNMSDARDCTCGLLSLLWPQACLG